MLINGVSRPPLQNVVAMECVITAIHSTQQRTYYNTIKPQLLVTVLSYFIGVGIPSSDKHLSFGPPEAFTL